MQPIQLELKMLKNILNNLNKPKQHTEPDKCQMVDTREKDELANVISKQEIASKSAESGKPEQIDPKANNKKCVQAENSSSLEGPKKKRLISGKGRRRLSAMVGRLQASIQAAKSKSVSKFSSQASNQWAAGFRNKLDPYNLDDGSDDDAYKSAEEMCHQQQQDDEDSGLDTTEPLEQTKRFSRRAKNVSMKLQGSQQARDAGLVEHQSVDELLPEERCDIPTFLQTENCDQHLIDETRRLLRERYANNPDSFYDFDYKRMLSDDWTVSRFLLRRRQDPKRTAKLMEECGRFRKQYKMSEVKLWEFPMEFHKAGGLFKYAPDRVGNVTLYMRVKMYRRVPEISDVFKAFILCVLEQCDRQNNGRGTAIIFDLSGCGLQNVDLGFLSWLLASFRNYCPKGVSYIIVYNLPWILNATCKLAMTWMSASNRRALRFAYGREIETFISRDNLPDYCGGTCNINYRSIPEGSLPAIEVCDRLDMSKEQALKIRELFKEYLGDDSSDEEHLVDSKSHYFDAKSLGSAVEQANDTTPTTMTSDNHPPVTNLLATTGTEVATTNRQQAFPRIPVVDLVSKASRFIAH